MTKWTVEELKQLHSIVIQDGKKPGIVAFRKAAKILGKSVGSCERKFSRIELGFNSKTRIQSETYKY